MFFTVIGLVSGITEVVLGLALLRLSDHPHFRDLRRARRLLRILGWVTGLLGALDVGESAVELGFDHADNLDDDD